MNTLLTVVPKLAPIVYSVLEKDGNHEYGLVYNVDYGVIRTTHFKAFDYIDDVLVVEKVDSERAHWWIQSFKAGKGYWDGTSFLPDKGKVAFFDFDALFKASLFHDVIYKKAEAISKATGVPIDKIFAFADDMLKILAEGYGADKRITHPIHWIVRTGGKIYHNLKKIVCVLAVSSLCGCYTVKTEMESPPPSIEWEGPVFSFLTTSNLKNDEFVVQTNGSDSTHVLDDSRRVLAPDLSNVETKL